jgi:hypothetical protein
MERETRQVRSGGLVSKRDGASGAVAAIRASLLRTRPDHDGLIPVAQSIIVGKSNTTQHQSAEGCVMVARIGEPQERAHGELLRRMTQRRGFDRR